MIEFVAGPYVAPKCRVGTVLEDVQFGMVKVVGFSAAPIRWPLHESNYKSEHIPVLCGDLVRAVIEETAKTVMQAWGITEHRVRYYRKAVANTTKDSDVWAALAVKRKDPEFRKKYGYPPLVVVTRV